MKLCIAQTRPAKGDMPQNTVAHIRFIDLAIANGADLIIFPELSITGYEPELAAELATTPEDSRFDIFQQISDTRQVTIGIGVPTRTEQGICIGLVIFQPGQPRHLYSKKYLHPDEEPFFVSGETTTGLIGGNASIALAICYEISVPEHSENAHKQGAGVYIASVAKSVAGVEKAVDTLSHIASRYSMPVLMANCIGPCDNFEAGGKSAVWNSKGELAGQLSDTHEGILVFDTETQLVIPGRV
ncbi:carbon-nitrogen hydrolase family protein [Nibrella saemangeumensis]|uniref:Carbon-nitrogen hydrolase family protein n=1 Tax=Nibrella saemangeumensis TaxID=1084526 RepID=A0ABP8NPR8_9BACT